jgi:hypothetical protein
MKTIYLTILYSLLSLNFLSAQIVNIEDRRNSVLDTAGWSGFLDLRFNLIENGATIISTRSSARVDYLKDRHHFFSISQYNFGKVEDEAFLEDGFQHFRYNFRWRTKLTWEAFTQLQYNEKINLRMRWLLGAGPRFTIFDNQKNKMFIGLLYLYEYNEEFFEEDQNIFSREHRLSTYFSFILKPTSTLSFSGTTYFQPSVDNFRVASQHSLNFKILKNLSFSSGLGLSYDSSPPGDVVNLIYQFTNGIRWTF